MRESGAKTFAQDEASSVVFGMPKETFEMGAVDSLTPLSSMLDTVLRQMEGKMVQEQNIRTDVGIGDFHASGNPGELIKSYALGSCVAVLMYDKVRRIAGMIHAALQESRVNAEKAETRPGYFADTGIPALLQAFSAARGASILDQNRIFDIGRRNVIAIKRALQKYGLEVIAEYVG